MEVASLSSGSSGNCFYISDDKSAVIVDVGISAKQVFERMSKLNLDVKKLKAIFITHEHIDHIKGVDVLARKLNLPVYGTKDTLSDRFICSDKELLNFIKRDNKTRIDSLLVEAFSKSHGAADPVSFTISADKRVSIITDAGYACENIKKHISQADVLVLESNHDEFMLENGPYPQMLKRLIRGDKGHLSNRQAAELIVENASPNLKALILAHLSETNNTIEHAISTMTEMLAKHDKTLPELYISTRHEPLIFSF